MMKSITSHETNRKRLDNQECRLHSLSFCRLCHYDGSYSLDIENPAHQAIISNYLAKSRQTNFRELMFERTNERRNNRRQFIRRIREQPRDEPVAASEEIVILSSDDDSDFSMTSAPTPLNAVQVQKTPEPATVPTASRKYDHAAGGKNISNTSPKQRLMEACLGITMPAGTPGTLTASVNYTAPGTRPTNYSVQWLSQPNSSTTSFASSGMNSVSSKITSRQEEPVLNGSDFGEALLTATALMCGLIETSATAPEGSMNTFQAKSSSKEGTRIAKPLPETVRSSASAAPHSGEANILQRPSAVTGNVSNQHTSGSCSVVDAYPSMLSTSAVEGQTEVSGNTMGIPPPTCCNRSGSLAPTKLCSEKCSEGRCHIIKCNSKDCPTYIPSTKTDGNCRGEESLARFLPAENSQPWKQKKTFPRQISLDKCLKVPMQTRISPLSSGRESTSSSCSIKNRSPYSSSQSNRMILGNLVGHSAPIMPLTMTSSIGDIEQSHGRPQPRSIEIPVKFSTPPENTSSPGTNQKKLNSSQTMENRSPDKVVESYLTRELSSSTAPTRNIVFSSGRRLARGIPSSSDANPSQPSTNRTDSPRAVRMPFATDLARPTVQMDATSSRESTLNRDVNHLRHNALSVLETAVPNRLNTPRSSNKHYLEAEEPPLKRFHYLELPKSTTANVVDATPRTLYGGIPHKSNDPNATTPLRATSLVTTSHSMQPLINMTTYIHPALDEYEISVPAQISTGTKIAGPIVPVNASSGEPMVVQDTNHQPDQPLPPFESINGKFPSRIKEYWDKPTPPENEDQPLRNKPDTYVQKICEWLLNSLSEPLLPMLLSTTEDNSASAAAIIPASRSDDIHNEVVQNCKQPTTPRPAGIINRRKLAIPTRIPSLAELTPIQGAVCDTRISPYEHKSIPRSEAFLISCDGDQGFMVSSSILERACPTLKDFMDKCGRWYEIDGVEYRIFGVLGVTVWDMLEILKFVFHDSHNHNFMRTSNMKRLLGMLKINYEETQTFISRVD